MQTASKPAGSAERMRRCRERLAAGAVRVSFDLSAASLDHLVSAGFLSPNDRKIPAAVAAALTALTQRTATFGGAHPPSDPASYVRAESKELGSVLAAAIARRRAHLAG